MVDEEHLRNLVLRKRPLGQRLVARFFLLPNYQLPPRSHITIEGLENIPRDRTVFFALNHTDRFNYWPFQWKLWKLGNQRFTTSWVKAKYYQNSAMAYFLDHCNNIPLPSKGYVILQDALKVLNRKLGNREYRLLRDFTDGTISVKEAYAKAPASVLPLLQTRRDDFDPAHEDYGTFIRRSTTRLMKLVEARTLEALGECDNNIIVFPQGTRSIRLLAAKTGLFQFALRHRIDIVPVGSNGSESLYPGASPWAKPGHVVYRVGRPLTMQEDFSDCVIEEPYTPFTEEAEQFQTRFEIAAHRTTQAINKLLDAPYQMLDEQFEEGSRADRLI